MPIDHSSVASSLRGIERKLSGKIWRSARLDVSLFSFSRGIVLFFASRDGRNSGQSLR